MAFFGLDRLPHRSTLSRFLAALDQTPVEALRALFLEDLVARPPEMAKEAFVQGLCMSPSASQPSGDGRLSGAEDPFSGRRIQPFGQCSEHYGDVIGKGFQTV